MHVAPGFLSAAAWPSGSADLPIGATREQSKMLSASGDRPDQIPWDTAFWSATASYPSWADATGCYRRARWCDARDAALATDAAGHGLSDTDARARGRLLTFAGALGEQYVLRLVRSSLRHAEVAGAVQVRGEIEFDVGRDRRDSPHVAIASRSCRVLIEVYSDRMFCKRAPTPARPCLLQGLRSET